MARFKRIKIIRWFILVSGLFIGINFLLKSGQNPSETITSDRNKILIPEQHTKNDAKSRQQEFENKNKEIKISDLKSYRKILGENKENINKEGNENKSKPKADAYYIELTKKRIERLINKLLEKEKIFSKEMKQLGLIMFENLIEDKDNKKEKDEQSEFLKVDGNLLTITENFIKYLHNLSDFYSFKNPRNNIKKLKFNTVTVNRAFILAD